MVRGPWAGHDEFAVLELLCGGIVAVLVLLDVFGVDQVGDVEKHSVRVHFLAADFFFEGVKELVNLD